MSRLRGAVSALGLALVAFCLVAPAGAAAVPRSPTPADDPSGLTVGVTIPESSSGPVEVTGAQLRWGLSAEAGAGAFFGGCNFLVAGAVGDTGGGRVWAEGDGFYAATAGNVSVERPTADGSFVPSTFATRCSARDGRPVSTADLEGSGAEVVIDHGVGVVDRATGTATVRWSGAFTVVLYGGLSYWSASDPVLAVGPDGSGTLTATASGYGSSMEDLTRWEPLRPTTVVLADLRGVSLADPAGFSVVPEYVGVAISGAGIDQSPRDDSSAAYWGSFPQSLVGFLVDAGQAAYWYTSGGVRDRAKPATRLYTSYDARTPVVRVDDPARPQPAPAAGGAPAEAAGPGSTRPATPTGIGSGLAEAAPTGTTSPPAAASPPTVLPFAGLIPATVAGALGAVPEAVLWSVGGLLSLTSIGVLGLAKGWLVLPWSR